MIDGINLSTLCARFPNANYSKYLPTIDFLANENLLEKSENKIKLTARGRLVADAIAVELL
jgi:coproporphyrinogen III oxidase-like Fe-S oxidoreductase